MDRARDQFAKRAVAIITTLCVLLLLLGWAYALHHSPKTSHTLAVSPTSANAGDLATGTKKRASEGAAYAWHPLSPSPHPFSVSGDNSRQIASRRSIA